MSSPRVEVGLRPTWLNEVTLSDGSTAIAKLINYDPDTDLAISKTLQWLADRTDHQRVDPSDPTERLQKVVDQLSYFSWWRYPGILGRLLWNEMRLRWERIWKKRRMQGRSEPAGCFAR
jgi:hypothetical protein